MRWYVCKGCAQIDHDPRDPFCERCGADGERRGEVVFSSELGASTAAFKLLDYRMRELSKWYERQGG